MIVTYLELENLRCIESAEFRFQPGMNLIVGVNGIGKTSVLDALGICLSGVVKEANRLRSRKQSFSANDIRIGADALATKCFVRHGDQDSVYHVHKTRERNAPLRKSDDARADGQLSQSSMPASMSVDESVAFHEESESLLIDNASSLSKWSAAPGPCGQPLAVLFSTNRAVPSERAPSKGVAAGGIAGAFADALANRELRLGELAAWMKAQEALRKEWPAAARRLAACEKAVERFLPGYRNLRQEGENPHRLCIDRDGTTIPVRQLSDGERGSLALVLDLTRRLAQANLKMDDPASEAEAVVLIDEIELHLHPKWQRQIIHNLTDTFPRCQFIATTHSPQVIGEVPHDRIQIIADGQVYSPTHSFGVDSSRVLEEIMEADPRARKVQELLDAISHAIGRQHFDHGRELLKRLTAQIGETDPEVTRLHTLFDFMEGNE